MEAIVVLFVNTIKIFEFKAKDSEINKIALVFNKYVRRFFGKKNEKKRLNGCIYNFYDDYKTFDTYWSFYWYP